MPSDHARILDELARRIARHLVDGLAEGYDHAAELREQSRLWGELANAATRAQIVIRIDGFNPHNSEHRRIIAEGMKRRGTQ